MKKSDVHGLEELGMVLGIRREVPDGSGSMNSGLKTGKPDPDPESRNTPFRTETVRVSGMSAGCALPYINRFSGSSP